VEEHEIGRKQCVHPQDEVVSGTFRLWPVSEGEYDLDGQESQVHNFQYPGEPMGLEGVVT
jgi:hypothetical protein